MLILRGAFKSSRNSILYFLLAASSTLRKACMETQYDTCNLPRKPEGMKWPDGYRSPKRLAQLFGECPETRHFCVQDIRGPITRNYANFNTRTFLHLFPFRNYDEWALSALKQISYRDGDEGCQEMNQQLDRCIPHKWELNFEKYTKFILSGFIKSFERVKSMMKGESVNDKHHILLHNYLDLDETLKWLHDSCGVPILPGTGMKINSDRPDESCKDEEGKMKKFHDCFSDKLARLN